MQEIQVISYLQKLNNYISRVFQSKFAKDLSITFCENVLTKGINFLIILMLTRLLGPEDYGKYSFIFVLIAFCSAFFDFGMENTAVRFSAKEKKLGSSIFGLYFIAKMLVLVFLTIFIILFGEKVLILTGKSEIIQYMPFIIIGLIGESLFFVNDTYLQSVQKFKARAILNISRYFASLLLIIILYLKGFFLLKYLFLIYLIPLVFSIGFLSKYAGFLKNFFRYKLNKNLIIEIYQYEKWMFILSIGNNILGRIDFLMLSIWVSYSQLGIYNAAFQLAAIVSFLPMVLGKVMLPKLSEQQPLEIFKTTKKIAKSTTILALLMVLIIPLTNILVPLLLGADYNSSIPILQIMLLSFLLSFITLPFDQALYALGKPKYSALIKFIQIVIIIILNILLIPVYGIIWAAINVLIARLFSFIITKLVLAREEKIIKEVMYDFSGYGISYKV